MSCHIWEKDFESAGKLAQEVMTHLPQEIHRPTSGITNSAGSKGVCVCVCVCVCVVVFILLFLYSKHFLCFRSFSHALVM